VAGEAGAHSQSPDSTHLAMRAWKVGRQLGDGGKLLTSTCREHATPQPSRDDGRAAKPVELFPEEILN